MRLLYHASAEKEGRALLGASDVPAVVRTRYLVITPTSCPRWCASTSCPANPDPNPNPITRTATHSPYPSYHPYQVRKHIMSCGELQLPSELLALAINLAFDEAAAEVSSK